MTMSEPSTPLLFEENELPSMSSSEAGLARTSALRARALAWTENAADYGAKSPVWLASFDPSSSSWRTAQTCLASTGALTLAAYSGTWPRLGTMRNGTASALPDLTHPTSVIASGLWRTGEEFFPTRNGGNLIEAVSMMLYPTPTARDWKSGKVGPAIADHRGNPKNSRPLNEVVLLPTPTASRRSGLQSHGENAILGSLNPDWVEWLMGLPIGWTASTPSATATPRSSSKR